MYYLLGEKKKGSINCLNEARENPKDIWCECFIFALLLEYILQFPSVNADHEHLLQWSYKLHGNLKMPGTVASNIWGARESAFAVHWRYQYHSSGLASKNVDSRDCGFKWNVKLLFQFKAFLQHLEPKIRIRIKHSEGDTR